MLARAISRPSRFALGRLRETQRQVPVVAAAASQRRFLKISRDEAYKASMEDPEKFWAMQAALIDWFKPYDRVLTVTSETDADGWKWYAGGKTNMCYNALDRHVAQGRGDQTAYIFDSPVTNTLQRYSYKETLSHVQEIAGYLRAKGVGKGDRVVIFFPNIYEAAVAMLACARIGAVHSVVFGGFAAPELAVRIQDCKPKAILAASCGVDGSKVIDYKILLDSALDLVRDTHQVDLCMIYQRAQQPCGLQAGRDVDWEEARRWMRQEAQQKWLQQPCEAMDATDPLYVLYTSGTTGAPKGIVRETGGYAVSLAYSFGTVYDIRAGDVMWAASDVGWVLGHSCGVYGPLVVGATSVLYEGKPIGTPDAANYWRVMERHRVNAFFGAPTAIRAMKRQDSEATLATQFDLSSLRAMFLGGEHADTATIQWVEHATARARAHQKQVAGHDASVASLLPSVPVRDQWWQTETGWAICADQLDGVTHHRLDPKDTIYGTCYKPVPGWRLRIFDADTQSDVTAKPFAQGQILLQLPLPPGAASTLYKAPERYQSSYLSTRAGFYDTGDTGYCDEQGNVFVMARSDDVINVAGHRLSTGALEEAVALHPQVAEAAVIGIHDAMKGQVPLAILVLNADGASSEAAPSAQTVETVSTEVKQLVRDRIGPIATLGGVLFVDKLPKTRSGKVLRAVLREVANEPPLSGEKPLKVPPTIEDMAVLQDVVQLIRSFRDERHQQHK